MKKIEKLFEEVNENQELAKRLFESESAKEVKELAAEVGIELTVEEVKEAGKLIVDKLEGANGDGELSEDDLDNVAGGFGGVSLLNIEEVNIKMPSFNPLNPMSQKEQSPAAQKEQLNDMANKWF